MPEFRRFALTVALAAASTVAAFAADPGASAMPQVLTSPTGIRYVVGGTGAESQEAMKRMQGDFSLRIVYSAAAGDYAIADRLTIKRGSTSVLEIEQAGPIVMVALRPGDFRITTTMAGKSESRTVKVGAKPQTLNWKVAAS